MIVCAQGPTTVGDAARSLRVSTRVVMGLCRVGTIAATQASRRGAWRIHKLPMDGPTLTTEAIANCLAVSERVVRRWCKDERVACVKIGRSWRIDFDDGSRLIMARVRRDN